MNEINAWFALRLKALTNDRCRGGTHK